MQNNIGKDIVLVTENFLTRGDFRGENAREDEIYSYMGLIYVSGECTAAWQPLFSSL